MVPTTSVWLVVEQVYKMYIRIKQGILSLSWKDIKYDRNLGMHMEDNKEMWKNIYPWFVVAYVKLSVTLLGTK